MGYEKLLTSLYGSTPQIDLDKQIARVRVPKPQTLDFKLLGEGIIKNNMGVGGIFFAATAGVREETLVLQPTGQTFRLRGNPPSDCTPAWRRMQVHDWEDPTRISVEILR